MIMWNEITIVLTFKFNYSAVVHTYIPASEAEVSFERR